MRIPSGRKRRNDSVDAGRASRIMHSWEDSATTESLTHVLTAYVTCALEFVLLVYVSCISNYQLDRIRKWGNLQFCYLIQEQWDWAKMQSHTKQSNRQTIVAVVLQATKIDLIHYVITHFYHSKSKCVCNWWRGLAMIFFKWSAIRLGMITALLITTEIDRLPTLCRSLYQSTSNYKSRQALLCICIAPSSWFTLSKRWLLFS